MKTNSKIIIASLLICGVIAAVFISNKVGKDNNEECKIGVIFPMSSGGQSSGLSAFNALEMCANEWNEKGGILGKKIVFDLQDSKGDPKEGLTIATRMLSLGGKPNTIISAISGVTLNVQTVTEKNGTILMGIIGADNFLGQSKHFSLRNFVTSQITSQAILDIVKTKFSDKRFNVAYCNTELGQNFSRVIKEHADSFKIPISDFFAFEEDETNYRNEILRHSFNDDDIIYVIGVDRPLGLFIKQLRQSGFKGTIIGDINIINSSCVDVIGEYMTNMYYITIKENNSSVNEKYKSLYGKEMDVLALYCYNGLDLLLSFINENKNMDNKYIMNNINGYEYNSKIGKIQVNNNEFNYEHELIEIK